MMSARTHATRRRQAGMSLVELMVGMLVGLIGIIIIAHLYVTNDQYQRSTSGAGTAQVAGAIALYMLEREIRQAGFGVNHSGALECSCVGVGCSPVRYYYKGRWSFPPNATLAGARPALTLAPVVIVQNAAGSTDSITIFAATDAERVLPTTLLETMATSQTAIKPDGIGGFDMGNLAVMASGTTCGLVQISAIPNPVTQELVHVGGDWNDPAIATMPAFGSGSLIFGLGTTPLWRRYTVVSNKLQMADMSAILGDTLPIDLVDDIVDMQALYGKDTGGDDVVDTWDTVTPTTGAGWLQVRAIRIAVLARSGNYERPSTPGGACEATLVGSETVNWSGGTFNVPGGLPSCYKYRGFETIVPLRNMIWRPA
jgi:type IV pilus assembly protein PilW